MFILIQRKRKLAGLRRSNPADPAYRRKPPIFLTTDWRRLAMLNYEIDPASLEAHTPAGVELDTWNGRHYVSVVGLMFLNTRLYGIPVPFHRDFAEVNLRFYVRRRIGDEVRRGVVFIKEIVPKRAIALVARAVYNENYAAMPMSHSAAREGAAYSVGYGWGKPPTDGGIQVRVVGEPSPLRDNTEEEFIAEHYWGYAAQRDGGTLEYEVEHPRWRIWRAEHAVLRCDVERLYGGEFASAISGAPASAFLAEGSSVIVRRGVRI